MDFLLVSTYMGMVLRIGALLLALPILSYVSYFVSAACTQRFSRHMGLLVGHIIFYGGVIFIGVNLLHEFGFNVTALLGAAGVIGVAIGFASQTSISNIISGFFLLLERPFSVGDMIKSGDIVGFAESIDLLAIRVRTRDNRLIRIPNEIILKQPLVNLTYFPHKRVDLLVSVPYSLPISVVNERILSVVASNSLCLTIPKPIVVMSSIKQLDFDTHMRAFFSVRVWVEKEQFFTVPAQLINSLKAEFDKDNTIITVEQLN